MEFAATSAFAVLQRRPKGRGRSFRISSTLENVLPVWDGATRISPVFPVIIDSDPVIEHPFKGKHLLFFIGPVSPARLRDIWEQGNQMWCTLGAFNVILRTSVVRGPHVRRWLGAQGVRYEAWLVTNGSVQHAGASRRSRKSPALLSELAQLISDAPSAEDRHSLIEYSSLMATALVRSAASMPSFETDLIETHRLVKATQSRGDLDKYARVGILTTVNAALGRLTSDSLSGASAILENECHLWPHSLLGIGVANMALARVRTFVHDTLATACLPERVEALDAVTTVPDLQEIPSNHIFWGEDHLKDVMPRRPPEEPLFSPLIYFSGRDHFRSTLNTLSVPLASLHSCNSVRWSLLTLTHEISHIVLRGIMSVIYPDPSDPVDLAEARRLLPAGAPVNVREELQRLVLRSALAMDKAHRLDLRETTANLKIVVGDLSGILRRWHHEIEEILTHVFDFLYFYGADEDRYIRAIWLSWSVIPAISSKVPQYVIRSLCVLLSKFMNQGENAQEVARKRLIAILEGLQNEANEVNYVRDAIRYLKEEQKDIQAQLFARRNLVRVVKILHSQTIASGLGRETRLVGGQTSRSGYPHRVRDMNLTPFDNPLRFLGVYTDANVAHDSHSAWMLYALAFAVD